jgi:hypothetical protein
VIVSAPWPSGNDQVEQDGVDAAVAETPGRVGEALDVHEIELLPRERLEDEAGVVRIVLDQEHSDAVAWRGWAPARGRERRGDRRGR